MQKHSKKEYWDTFETPEPKRNPNSLVILHCTSKSEKQRKRKIPEKINKILNLQFRCPQKEEVKKTILLNATQSPSLRNKNLERGETSQLEHLGVLNWNSTNYKKIDQQEKDGRNLSEFLIKEKNYSLQNKNISIQSSGRKGRFLKSLLKENPEKINKSPPKKWEDIFQGPYKSNLYPGKELVVYLQISLHPLKLKFSLFEGLVKLSSLKHTLPPGAQQNPEVIKKEWSSVLEKTQGRLHEDAIVLLERLFCVPQDSLKNVQKNIIHIFPYNKSSPESLAEKKSIVESHTQIQVLETHPPAIQSCTKINEQKKNTENNPISPKILIIETPKTIFEYSKPSEEETLLLLGLNENTISNTKLENKKEEKKLIIDSALLQTLREKNTAKIISRWYKKIISAESQNGYTKMLSKLCILKDNKDENPIRVRIQFFYNKTSNETTLEVRDLKKSVYAPQFSLRGKCNPQKVLPLLLYWKQGHRVVISLRLNQLQNQLLDRFQITC